LKDGDTKSRRSNRRKRKGAPIAQAGGLECARRIEIRPPGRIYALDPQFRKLWSVERASIVSSGLSRGEKHDCWTTTEAVLTQDLSEDLRDAWERVRETAVSFGDQRIYASHKSIMFSTKSCYFFVRPKKNFLELCVFLGRTLKAPQVRRVDRASKSKLAHVIQVRHRDEVEEPLTEIRAAHRPKVRLAPPNDRYLFTLHCALAPWR